MCDAAICPIKSSNAGKGNSLGFSGAAGAACCVLPCPAYPIHTINICVLVNIETSVKIQQGCLKEHHEYYSESSDSDSDVDNKDQNDIGYSHGQTYDSWGRKCRVVNWSRKVPDDAFIRLRFYGVDGDEEPCEDYIGNNQLLKYEVDGVDVTHMLRTYLGATLGGSPYHYVKAGCAGAPRDGETHYTYLCCSYRDHASRHGPTGSADYTLQDIPRGAEIVVGPISDLPYAADPTR